MPPPLSFDGESMRITAVGRGVIVTPTPTRSRSRIKTTFPLLPPGMQLHQRVRRISDLVVKAAMKPGGPVGHSDRVDYMKDLSEHTKLPYEVIDQAVQAIGNGATEGSRKIIEKAVAEQDILHAKKPPIT
jgi:hypothetical protein